MQSFKEALKILEESKEFKEWKKKNPEAYLSYGFFMVEENDANWKIGYYHKKADKVTSFNIGKNKIMIEPETEVFKKEETKIEAIELNKIKLDLAEAVAIANQLQKEEYASENPQKIICILQKLKKHQVWNITFLTQNFNTLNFKIKSDSGRVIEKKLANVIEFRKS